jgi:hypothetical protein
MEEKVDIFDSKQLSLLDDFTNSLDECIKSGIAIIGVSETGTLLVSKKSAIDKFMRGEQSTTEEPFTHEDSIIVEKLNDILGNCTSTDILFHNNKNGLYAINKTYYNKFCEEHPDSCTDTEWVEFQQHVLPIEHHGAYIDVQTMKEASPEATCSCTGCDVGCDEPECTPKE